MSENLPRLFHSNECEASFWDDQCNCACPTYIRDDPSGNFSASGIFQQAPVHIDQLAFAHKLLFNVAQPGQVVVLNPAAYELWQTFQTPHSLTNLNAVSASVISQMLQTHVLEPAEKHESPCRPTPDTLSVWLHVTNACNLNCSYCYVQKSNQHMSLETGRAAVDAVLRSAHGNGFRKVSLKFSGGEPTLCLDRVFDLYSYALAQAALHEIELDGVILSNGYGLNEHSIAQIKAHGLRLMLSVDGMGASHDAQRPLAGGAGSFERAWNALEQAAAQGLKPFVSVTVTEQSAAGLPDLIRRLLAFKLPFNLNFARPVSAEKPLDPDKILAGVQAALTVIAGNLSEYSLLGGLLDRTFFASGHERPCGVGDSYMVIDQQGQIAGCQMALSETVTDIYAPDPLAVIRHAVSYQNPTVAQKEGCSQCQWRYVCAGGCPRMALLTNGEYASRSPFCSIYQQLFPELLRLEGLRILKFSHTLPNG